MYTTKDIRSFKLCRTATTVFINRRQINQPLSEPQQGRGPSTTPRWTQLRRTIQTRTAAPLPLLRLLVESGPALSPCFPPCQGLRTARPTKPGQLQLGCRGLGAGVRRYVLRWGEQGRTYGTTYQVRYHFICLAMEILEHSGETRTYRVQALECLQSLLSRPQARLLCKPISQNSRLVFLQHGPSRARRLLLSTLLTGQSSESRVDAQKEEPRGSKSQGYLCAGRGGRTPDC